MEDNPAAAVVLQSIRDKADRVIENLEERKAALDELRAIAEEKDQLRRFAKQAGLSERAFGVYSALSAEPALSGLRVDFQYIATTIEIAVSQFPHWKQNPDERRRLRSGLYKPLLDNKVPAKACNEIIENVMNVLEKI